MAIDGHDAASVRVPPPLVFLVALVGGAMLNGFALPFPVKLPIGPRIGISATIAVLGVALMALAIGLFARTGQDPKPWKTTPEIISTGIYRWTRNPMYLSMALIQSAVGIGAANGWILSLVPVVLVTVYLTAIRHEEAYLEGKFGDAYRDYKRRVRRWL